MNNPVDAVVDNTTQRKRTVRNIALVPYKPKPKDWGSWKIKSPYATSTVASPIPDDSEHIQNSEGKLTYVPHSPYYEPVRSPQFYGMSENVYSFSVYMLILKLYNGNIIN